MISREHNFRAGELHNVEDAKSALRDIFLLQLFDIVQVVPRPDDNDPSKVQVDIVPVRDQFEQRKLNWRSIALGDGGRPDFVSVRPGGSVLFEHRNLDGWGRQLFGSVSTANFFQPQDDLGFKIEYNHPYCKGEFDAEKSSFRTSILTLEKFHQFLLADHYWIMCLASG